MAHGQRINYAGGLALVSNISDVADGSTLGALNEVSDIVYIGDLEQVDVYVQSGAPNMTLTVFAGDLVGGLFATTQTIVLAGVNLVTRILANAPFVSFKVTAFTSGACRLGLMGSHKRRGS